jgi:pyruvate,water dikinase
LSRLAAKSASVREVVENAAPEELFERLERSAEGREFARAFRAYLGEFGWRGDSWSMDDRTWISYPRTPQSALRGYLAQPDGSSPELAHAALSAAREAPIAAARERLTGSPPEVRAQFEGLLSAAQFSLQLQENHNYYIDQMLQHLARRAFVEAGKRLVGRGQTADPEDVLFLTVDEVRGQLRSTDHPDLRSLVQGRRAELTLWRTLTPPRTLGAPPPPGSDRPDRFWGGPPPASTETQIKGNAGSRGQVTGLARVAMTLTDAASLLPGEVLVCPTTAPPWTPLFATAAAVVTDTGGILSHCAVVAREYGIPAVVGTGVATQRIRTGQRVTVDGAAGTVTLE